jgi:hypothetical protein
MAESGVAPGKGKARGKGEGKADCRFRKPKFEGP